MTFSRSSLVSLALGLVLSLSFVAGCAESTTGRRDTGAPSPDATTGQPDTGVDAGARADTGAPSDSGAAAPGLVVNEIEATGTEFVELLNTGSTPVDLSALRFTDDDTGMPNAAHATMLPAGVVLHTGDRFVIVTNVTGAAAGLSMGAACMLTGVDRCMQVTFGLSNTNGDGAYVLASDDSIVASALYPAMGAATGESYCRLPDGSGAFTHCTPSPAAANTP